MSSPRVLILRAPGTNCDEEAAHAFSLAGGAPERQHVNRVLEARSSSPTFRSFASPEVFPTATTSPPAASSATKSDIACPTHCKSFRDAGKLIIGICNGFQVLLKTELLVPMDTAGSPATLAANDSGHFEDRWVQLATSGNKCVFLSGIDGLELPVAHGEGKFVTRDAGTLK